MCKSSTTHVCFSVNRLRYLISYFELENRIHIWKCKLPKKSYKYNAKYWVQSFAGFEFKTHLVIIPLQTTYQINFTYIPVHMWCLLSMKQEWLWAHTYKSHVRCLKIFWNWWWLDPKGLTKQIFSKIQHFGCMIRNNLMSSKGFIKIKSIFIYQVPCQITSALKMNF